MTLVAKPAQQGGPKVWGNYAVLDVTRQCPAISPGAGMLHSCFPDGRFDQA